MIATQREAASNVQMDGGVDATDVPRMDSGRPEKVKEEPR